MIGEKFWSTGISIEWRKDENQHKEWSARIEFFDDGFHQSKTTGGVLRSRYIVKDLAEIIDTLIEDAKKIGIEFKEMPGKCTPQIFMRGDGEDSSCEYPPGWKKICDDQARRIGWRPLYSEDVKLQG